MKVYPLNVLLYTVIYVHTLQNYVLFRHCSCKELHTKNSTDMYVHMYVGVICVHTAAVSAVPIAN